MPATRAWGKPDTIQEQNYGDAGGALVIGSENVIAELVGTHTVSQEFIGTWRTEEQDYLKSFPGGFENKFGYNRFIAETVQGLLQKCNLEAKDVTNAAIAAPNQKALRGALRGLGFDLKSQCAGNILEYGRRRRDGPAAGPAGRGA